MTPEELLELVNDQESFRAFVHALAKERSQAQQMERDDPVGYQLSGAMNWQNGDIPAFLRACLCYFECSFTGRAVEIPTWRDFAEFLYYGKIYE